MRNIILVVMPIVLSAFIYNVNGTINSYMYSGIDGLKGLDDHTIQTMYAEHSLLYDFDQYSSYSGKYSTDFHDP